MKAAVSKAQNCGVAFVSIRNTGHIGAAGQYALQAARQGCAAIITGNDIPSVAAPGSRKAVLGSNPLAFAIPTAGDPILLDIATAAVAGGKVYAAWQAPTDCPQLTVPSIRTPQHSLPWPATKVTDWDCGARSCRH
jgi:ureidoglycolate dehydrogenase (NAD+)